MYLPCLSFPDPGATTSSFFCWYTLALAPFNAAHIHIVSQLDYAPSIFDIVSRMVEEEGLLSLFSSVPVWFVNDNETLQFIFFFFQITSDFLYESFPATREAATAKT